MAKYFIIGETDSKELWLVDLDNRSVEPLTEEILAKSQAADAGFVEILERARANGITTLKGVSIAIATNSRSEAVSQSFIVDPTSHQK
ncbi:hypothetical protein [Phyllobacterium sp. YR531]|uniref:hypothetical protein n=1 Tax=Phyllobacterium sp. YR531 TaxID=1144343 RepID=UPI00026F873D|nr:hypothetical protein [Phyllobacterium sp. YR531]EJN02136.1 hypothetical protein PMI41_02887 [Phyllobacterium sp. YR531]